MALTSLPHGLMVVDAERRLVGCNKRYADIYGIPPDLTKAWDALRRTCEPPRRQPHFHVPRCGARCNHLHRNRPAGHAVDPGAEAVINALAASGLPPERLELEITETTLLQDGEATLAMLYQLREVGVSIAMDDFGTGYSSLSYLQSFPFDRIKIDRSFIKDITDGVGSLNIVRAVAALAKGLGMETTAEGVETEQQREKVALEGCTEMQGYLFSQPRPAHEIEALYFPGLREEPGEPPMDEPDRQPIAARAGAR